jgi:hypothetical protein
MHQHVRPKRHQKMMSMFRGWFPSSLSTTTPSLPDWFVLAVLVRLLSSLIDCTQRRVRVHVSHAVHDVRQLNR